MRGDQQSAAGLVYVASSAAASRPSPASRPGQVEAFGPVRRGQHQSTLMVPDGRRPRAKRKKTRYTRWSFPGLAYAATCDLGREDLAHGNSAADRMPHDQRLCNYRQDLTAPLPTPCPAGGRHGRPEFRVHRGGGASRRTPGCPHGRACTELRPAARYRVPDGIPAVVGRHCTGRPGGHHAAQRARLPGRLLWRAGRRGHRRADEPAAQEP